MVSLKIDKTKADIFELGCLDFAYIPSDWFIWSALPVTGKFRRRGGKDSEPYLRMQVLQVIPSVHFLHQHPVLFTDSYEGVRGKFLDLLNNRVHFNESLEFSISLSSPTQSWQELNTRNDPVSSGGNFVISDLDDEKLSQLLTWHTREEWTMICSQFQVQVVCVDDLVHSNHYITVRPFIVLVALGSATAAFTTKAQYDDVVTATEKNKQSYNRHSLLSALQNNRHVSFFRNTGPGTVLQMRPNCDIQLTFSEKCVLVCLSPTENESINEQPSSTLSQKSRLTPSAPYPVSPPIQMPSASPTTSRSPQNQNTSTSSPVPIPSRAPKRRRSSRDCDDRRSSIGALDVAAGIF